MQIKVEISDAARGPLTEWAKREKTLQAQLQSSNSEYAALAEKVERLSSEIAALEEKADEDEAARKLAGKREQLSAVQRKIERFAAIEDDKAAQRARLGELRPLLRTALAPFVASETNRVADAIAPFFRDRASAEAVARQSDYIGHLSRFAFSTWEHFSSAYALATVETICAGSLPPFETAATK